MTVMLLYRGDNRKKATMQSQIHWHAAFMNSRQSTSLAYSMICSTVYVIVAHITFIFLPLSFIFNCNFLFFAIFFFLIN
jgi:hypothetical protein